MSQPRTDKSALPGPPYHWTTYTAGAFIGALAEFGRVSEAARAVGMCRQSAYRLRARLGEDGVFARAWDRALEAGRAKRATRRRPQLKATPLPPERDIFGIGK